LTIIDDRSIIFFMARNRVLVRILDEGARLVRQQGFRATGIKDVLTRAGVPKGSFYYYFGDKEDFGLHLVDFYAGFILSRMEDTLGNTMLPPLERLERFFDDFTSYYAEAGFAEGCPIGNLSQEMAGIRDSFREKLDAVFHAMTAQVSRCIEEARERGEVGDALDPGETAEFVMNSWEGAVLRSKLTRDAGPLATCRRMLFKHILAR
jgi:TetR/AcrR family transcriptional repressor of nem operon